MPIIKSAKKKVSQDKKKTASNKKYDVSFQKTVRAFKKSGVKSKDLVKKLFSSIDKASKKGILHKKKANRLKSNFSKMIRGKKPSKWNTL